jgi:7-carboxy-7-deazaguanine synthase
MSYAVKELFYTLQGEGAQAGRAAVFCRFTGCNLWSGREADRASAACTFCDTDFVGTDGSGGGTFAHADDLAQRIRETWDAHTRSDGRPFVVFTGGEPALQLDAPLIQACHERQIEVAIETNGTKVLPTGIDWICVSPKPQSEVLQTQGHELKFVYPQAALDPLEYEDWDFEHWFIQPMDGPNLQNNVGAAAQFCMQNPQWRLSLQTHKLIGIP